MKFPWGGSDPDREAGVELADRIRQMIAGQAEPRQIAAALADAPIGPARSALKQLLAKPYVLIPDDWWYKPASGLAANRKLDEAIGDAGVARLAAESLVELRTTSQRLMPEDPGHGHRQEQELLRMARSQYAYNAVGGYLAHFLVTAIERVPDGDLRDVVRSLLMVIEDLNDLKKAQLGPFMVPPPPPPRALMEAVGVLHKRDRDLAWTVLQALAHGHSNLARVLRRVASLDVPKGSVPQEADSLLDLVELAGAVKGPAPTASWLKRWLEVRARGGPALRATVLAVAGRGEKDDDGLWQGGSGADLVRAAVLALSSWDDEETRAFLQRTILMWARSGSGSPSIGTAAVWSLSSYGDSRAM
ncbi:MAG: hypothetical protein J2P28_21000, partial [Actinobacteria bacterium]|nr:hypothetical protein [Actinomycetota bacterium]